MSVCGSGNVELVSLLCFSTLYSSSKFIYVNSKVKNERILFFKCLLSDKHCTTIIKNKVGYLFSEYRFAREAGRHVNYL